MSSYDDYVELVEKAGKLGATARLDYAHVQSYVGC